MCVPAGSGRGLYQSWGCRGPRSLHRGGASKMIWASWGRGGGQGLQGERKAGLQGQGRREAGLGCQGSGFREGRLRRPRLQQLRKELPGCCLPAWTIAPHPTSEGSGRTGSQGSEEGLFIPRARMRYGLQGSQQCRWGLKQSRWTLLGKGSRQWLNPKPGTPAGGGLTQPHSPGLGAVAQEQGACPEATVFRGMWSSILWPLREPRP